MRLQYFSIGGRQMIQNAIPDYQDELNVTLEGVACAVYNDGLSWYEQDEYGNTYTKSGNTLTIHTTGGGSQVITVPANGAISLFQYENEDGKWLGYRELFVNQRTDSLPVSGQGTAHYHYRTFINDIEGQASDIRAYYNLWSEDPDIQTDWYNSCNIITGADGKTYGEFVVKYTNKYVESSTSYTIAPVKLYDGFTVYSIFSRIPFGDIEEKEIFNDPYAHDQNDSDDDDGNPSWDDDSADIDFPDNPSISAIDTGFVTLYNPTLPQLRTLSQYMWTDGFSITAFKKLFANPMDCIIGCHIVPCAVPHGSLPRDVVVGNISTGIGMYYATTQYVEVDCGTVQVKEYFGGYLNYDSYTKVDIYLPYIGIKPIRADDVMNKSVHLKYKIDLLSGSCVAMLRCEDSKAQDILYTFSGTCACQIPVTNMDFTQYTKALIGLTASAASSIAGASSGGLPGVDLASTANNILSLKPTVQKSNTIGSSMGFIAVQTPYFIITRPRICKPENLPSFTGYPSYTSGKLSKYKGFCQVKEIHLEGVPATQAEKDEIVNLLKAGVII